MLFGFPSIQVLLTIALLSFGSGFLTSCKYSYNHYKVKDLQQQVKVLKTINEKTSKIADEQERLEEKFVKDEKKVKEISDDLQEPVAKNETSLPKNTDTICPVVIPANRMRIIKRFQF